MYSPLYTAELKRLYPHANVNVTNKEQVAEYIKELIDKKAITLEQLNTTPLGILKRSYFLNADSFQISDGIDLYKNSIK